MRITSKGQVTIPQAFREKAGLLPGTEVEFELDGDSVRIRRAQAPIRSRARRDHSPQTGSASATSMRTLLSTRTVTAHRASAP